MSFGGGWFFLAASEAISVLNRNYTLPGLGSYVAAAIAAKDLHALFWAIVTMVILILAIDQFFWRPLVTLSDTYKLELSAGVPARFWVVDLWRASRLPSFVLAKLAPLNRSVDRLLSRATPFKTETITAPGATKGDRLYDVLLVLATACLIVAAVRFVLNEVSVREVGRAALLGLATGARVIFLIVAGTLVWTPVGVAIGFSPRLSRISQPLIQVLASFPANFLFPFATLLFIRLGVSLNWGSILLMALGAQWYLLFNIIGGAQSIPNDLREMAASIGLSKGRAWRVLIGPGIFASWVTGAITASGGAWNASIVSELVSWGNTTMAAHGLGAYISEATSKGDWPRIVLGVGLMSLFVVALNRFVWRRFYALAESKYRFG